MMYMDEVFGFFPPVGRAALARSPMLTLDEAGAGATAWGACSRRRTRGPGLQGVGKHRHVVPGSVADRAGQAARARRSRGRVHGPGVGFRPPSCGRAAVRAVEPRVPVAQRSRARARAVPHALGHVLPSRPPHARAHREAHGRAPSARRVRAPRCRGADRGEPRSRARSRRGARGDAGDRRTAGASRWNRAALPAPAPSAGRGRDPGLSARVVRSGRAALRAGACRGRRMEAGGGDRAAAEEAGHQPLGRSGARLLEEIPELDDQPDERARFADLPSVAAKLTSYKRWTSKLKSELYQQKPLQLWTCRDPKATSKPGETERDFAATVRQLWREERDQKLAKLESKYAPKLVSMENKIRTAEQRVEREKDQRKQKGLDTVVSIGSTISAHCSVAGRSRRPRSVGRSVVRPDRQGEWRRGTGQGVPGRGPGSAARSRAGLSAGARRGARPLPHARARAEPQGRGSAQVRPGDRLRVSALDTVAIDADGIATSLGE